MHKFGKAHWEQGQEVYTTAMSEEEFERHHQKARLGEELIKVVQCLAHGGTSEDPAMRPLDDDEAAMVAALVDDPVYGPQFDEQMREYLREKFPQSFVQAA